MRYRSSVSPFSFSYPDRALLPRFRTVLAKRVTEKKVKIQAAKEKKKYVAVPSASSRKCDG